jgi:hypothetical protein
MSNLVTRRRTAYLRIATFLSIKETLQRQQTARQIISVTIDNR